MIHAEHSRSIYAGLPRFMNVIVWLNVVCDHSWNVRVSVLETTRRIDTGGGFLTCLVYWIACHIDMQLFMDDDYDLYWIGFIDESSYFSFKRFSTFSKYLIVSFFFVTRRVFGYSTLLASVLTLLTPGSAALGFGWVVAVRVLLGFLLGATWPAILPMASKWIPPMDRSKFMSNMMGKCS